MSLNDQFITNPEEMLECRECRRIPTYINKTSNLCAHCEHDLQNFAATDPSTWSVTFHYFIVRMTHIAMRMEIWKFLVLLSSFQSRHDGAMIGTAITHQILRMASAQYAPESYPMEYLEMVKFLLERMSASIVYTDEPGQETEQLLGEFFGKVTPESFPGLDDLIPDGDE